MFLPVTVVRLGRPLLVSWEGSGGEGCEEEGWEEEVLDWVPAFSCAETMEPLFLLFFVVAWPGVTLASGF